MTCGEMKHHEKNWKKIHGVWTNEPDQE